MIRKSKTHLSYFKLALKSLMSVIFFYENRHATSNKIKNQKSKFLSSQTTSAQSGSSTNGSPQNTCYGINQSSWVNVNQKKRLFKQQELQSLTSFRSPRTITNSAKNESKPKLWENIKYRGCKSSVLESRKSALTNRIIYQVSAT